MFCATDLISEPLGSRHSLSLPQAVPRRQIPSAMPVLTWLKTFAKDTITNSSSAGGYTPPKLTIAGGGFKSAVSAPGEANGSLGPPAEEKEGRVRLPRLIRLRAEPMGPGMGDRGGPVTV